MPSNTSVLKDISWLEGALRDRAKKRMEQLGWTNAELAREMKSTTPSYIKGVLAGDNVGTLPYWSDVFRALGLTQLTSLESFFKREALRRKLSWGWSYRDLGEATGFHDAYLSNVLNGKRRGSVHMWSKTIEALDLKGLIR